MDTVTLMLTHLDRPCEYTLTERDGLLSVVARAAGRVWEYAGDWAHLERVLGPTPARLLRGALELRARPNPFPLFADLDYQPNDRFI